MFPVLRGGSGGKGARGRLNAPPSAVGKKCCAQTRPHDAMQREYFTNSLFIYIYLPSCAKRAAGAAGEKFRRVGH